MNIKTILVPTDFSENADRAFAMAIEFARTFDSSIQLLHVYDIPDTHTVYEVTFPEGVVESIRKAASLKLGTLKDQATAERIELSTELVFGSPSQAIVEHARESKADLIVMGTRGQGFLKHLLMGSVAERTLRTAPCPVLTISIEASTSG